MGSCPRQGLGPRLGRTDGAHIRSNVSPAYVLDRSRVAGVIVISMCDASIVPIAGTWRPLRRERDRPREPGRTIPFS